VKARTTDPFGGAGDAPGRVVGNRWEVTLVEGALAGASNCGQRKMLACHQRTMAGREHLRWGSSSSHDSHSLPNPLLVSHRASTLKREPRPAGQVRLGWRYLHSQ
jgi:hypothetical protein